MQYTIDQINQIRKEALIKDLAAQKTAVPSENFKAGLMKHHMNRLEQMSIEEKADSIKVDLQSAFDFASGLYEKTSGDWITAIDPESMSILKYIYKNVSGTYSLNRLAHAIRKGAAIKY